MPYRRKSTRRKGESLKSLAVKIDKLQHPRSQWAKAWVPKQYVQAPANGPGPGMVRNYGANHVVGSGMYTGRGGFWGDMWKGTAGVRGAVGNWARSQGGVVGALGGLSGALGIGDYTTNAIVNDGQGAAEHVPSFAPSGASSVTVSHKEYLTDIYGTAAGQSFQNSAFSLNPALQSTFPWLSQLAQNYDEYTIKQLIFTFRSSIAPIGSSGTGQVGTIIMATQYNAGEEPFSDKETMMQYDGAMSAKVIDGLISGVECDPAQNSGSYGKYTRAGPPPAGQDVKTYDLGVFNCAVTNIPATYENQSLGELWVSYTVELRKPKFFSASGLGIKRDVFYRVGAIPIGDAGFATGTVTTMPSGATDVAIGNQPASLLSGQQNNILTVPFNPVGTMFPAAFSTGILFPSGTAGAYTITWRYTSAQTGAPGTSALQFVPFGNVQLINDIPASIDGVTTTWHAASTNSINSYAVSAPSSGGTAQSCYLFTAHVRVSIATNGQENFFVLTGSLASQVASTSVYVDVHEYNTGFNYKQSGQNDQLVFENQGGQIVVP